MRGAVPCFVSEGGVFSRAMIPRSTVLLIALLSACTGPAGPPGEPGSQGPRGPEATPRAPPRLESLSPGWGSARTELTLVGQNFSTEPADNRVTFDGVPATVVSASAHQLVVKPGRAVTQARWVAVSVDVAQQTSNALEFELVPSGTPRAEQRPLLLSPHSVVRVGADLYVASESLSSSAGGLYRIEPDGRTTRVLEARFVPFQNPSQSRYDSIQFLATDGTDVWFTTSFNAVRRYHVATGQVSEVAQLTWRTIQSMTRSPGGTLFICTTAQHIYRISPSGEVTTISVPELAEAYGVVADGSDLFVANPVYGKVMRIANAAGTYSLTPDFATMTSAGLSLAVVDGKLVLGGYDGRLYAVDRNTGGVMTPYLAPEGYGGLVNNMFVDGEGALYLAQSVAGVVRRIAPGTSTASIIATGFRATSATVRLQDRWYFAGVSFRPFVSPPPGLPDGTILELSDDGVSRIVARGGDIRGLAALPDGRLAFSDCARRSISALEPLSGAVSELLGAADGLSCPMGLATDAGGALFYVDVTDTGASVGRWSAQGGHTSAFVTGLPREAFQLARRGDRLFVLTQGKWEVGVPEVPSVLYAADAMAGGRASVWMPPASMHLITGMGLAPSGTVYLAHPRGELLALEPDARLLSPVGGTLVLPVDPGHLTTASQVLSMGFKPDGTVLALDTRQYEVITVAP